MAAAGAAAERAGGDAGVQPPVAVVAEECAALSTPTGGAMGQALIAAAGENLLPAIVPIVEVEGPSAEEPVPATAALEAVPLPVFAAAVAVAIPVAPAAPADEAAAAPAGDDDAAGGTRQRRPSRFRAAMKRIFKVPWIVETP